MIVRKHYIFYGRVQGVGFRFTAYRKAIDFGLTGWVQNMMDGTVEVCFQGENNLIDRLVNELQNGHFIRIDSMKVEDIKLLKHETLFEIRN